MVVISFANASNETPPTEVVTAESKYGIVYAIKNNTTHHLECYLTDDHSYHEFELPPRSTSRYYLMRPEYAWECWVLY